MATGSSLTPVAEDFVSNQTIHHINLMPLVLSLCEMEEAPINNI